MRPDRARTRRHAVATLSLAALIIEVAMSNVRAAPVEGEMAPSVDHIVVSEVMTGGASASDEFVELYNPGPDARILDGLELVYVTATGATVTRKASWGSSVQIGPGGHLLVANESGLFAGIADATYANGLSAAGGSMALRAVGAATAIDAVGWGSATSTWLETAPAPAPPAGSSLERLPGGPLGSGQDTDHNLVDFVVRVAPDPQNSTSPPVPVESATPSPTDSPDATPSWTGSPTAQPSITAAPTATPAESLDPTTTPTPTPTDTPPPTPTASPTPTATPMPLTVAAARALPDGTQAVVAGISLTDGGFHDGGGYLADETGGIAVLVDGATFPRGVNLVVAGIVDDRYAQRTLRVAAPDLLIGSPGPEPSPSPAETAAIGESLEGQLVTVSGAIQGTPSTLTSGLAFEIDDGSGPIRVLVGPATGISTEEWQTGSILTLIGVVGQRDSSGTGTDGYRVQPRDASDITAIIPPTPEPTPTPVPDVSPSPAAPTPTPSPAAPTLVPIADARRADDGTRLRIRGVVTLPSGLVEEGSAVVADGSGAILVRAGSDLGRLRRGQLVELSGTRSTKSGMLSLRLSQQALVIGSQAEPVATRRATGVVREADEALLVIVRGLVEDGPRRTTSGGLTFSLDDGSGPLRVFVSPRTGITVRNLPSGAWVELRGVVGQQTTGAEPNVGYRLWPRDQGDVTLIAGPAPAGSRVTTTGTARAPIATDAPSRASVMLSRPDLQGGIGLAPRVPGVAGVVGSAPSMPPLIPVPLAAGLGGLAGLLVLAWRHGTIRRAVAELGVRRVAMWHPMNDGDEEDESYTPAP